MADEHDNGDFILSLDAFVRAIGINRQVPHAVFLGAGASISSGIPSSEACVWEWKKSIFLSNNPGTEQQFNEISLRPVQDRIQQWLDSRGNFPNRDDPLEYSYYIEKCYPICEHRRQFFAEKIRVAQPHLGYKFLCLLAEAEIVSWVWTTNFDGLVAKAAANFQITPIEVGIDCQQRLLRKASRGELPCISLHGDYRYDALKNTTEEVQQQEGELRNALIQLVRDTPIIVFGYAGRDASVMEALQEGYCKQGSGALYWCGYGDEVPDPVAELLTSARKAGRTAHFVPTCGFDDTMARLALHCLSGTQQDRVQGLLAEASFALKEKTRPFAIEELPCKGIIKSNVFETELPAEIFAFDIHIWPQDEVWNWLNGLSQDKPFVAVPHRGKILAIGDIDQIQAAFADRMTGSIERTPVTQTDTGIEHGAVNSLMRKALLRSLADATGSKTDGRGSLWESKAYTQRTIMNRKCNVHRAVHLYLRVIQNKVYVLLKPTVWIFDTSGNAVDKDSTRLGRNEILGYKHNKEVNEEIDHWRKILFQGSNFVDIEYPRVSASRFRFRIRCAPIFAQIGSRGKQSGINVNAHIRSYIKQRGIEISEPTLLFSNRQGTGIARDIHPTRGLASNRPYDYSLTVRGLLSSIKIGVICPRLEERKLSAYLRTIQSAHVPDDKEREYLVQFPGFQQAFGTPVEIPSPGDNAWGVCSEPDPGLSVEEGARDIAQRLSRTIEAIVAAERPHAVLVFIPARWSQWRGYSTDLERFDLHEFIKAYCVQRGIATQFLEEDTLGSNQQCRVCWWLSVALYAKAIRTPWVLDSLDPDTAYLGLGYSIDRTAERQQRILLGCSHLYNAQGEGLQFRLTKVEDPIMKGKNPHMSYDDARRTAEAIRQMFYESRMKLPQRVVIHKQTPYLDCEKEGLLSGLDGTDMVDLLEINIDNPFRYLSSVIKADGKFDIDRFPVRRGTVVQLDGNSALVWCHGVTDAIVPGRRYFQGKRNIPGPLLLRRFAGAGKLEIIATEILGLAKMDWNSADMYSKLPATIHSSKQIARIGAKLQRFGPVSYDYRLFM